MERQRGREGGREGGREKKKRKEKRGNRKGKDNDQPGQGHSEQEKHGRREKEDVVGARQEDANGVSDSGRDVPEATSAILRQSGWIKINACTLGHCLVSSLRSNSKLAKAKRNGVAVGPNEPKQDVTHAKKENPMEVFKGHV